MKKILIDKMNEKEFSNRIGDEIKYRFMEKKQNPDRIVLNIIKRVYGHKVEPSKFIKLIESSGF